MATTQQLHTGNGSSTLFNFTFEYLKESDIKVSLDGVDQLTTAYSFANATTISFNTAPANGVAIKIYRQTAQETPPATFFAGSAIRASDLNENFLQTLYVAQETDQIARNLTAGDIAPGGVTNSLLADDAVTTVKIADLNVTTDKLADSAVTSDKIANDTIVNADVNASAAIAGTKVSPDFGSQNITTTGDATIGSLNGGQLAGTRNRIINGDMRIAQRGTGAVTVSASFPVDRWALGFITGGAASAQYETASTPTEFQAAIKFTTTTADATTDATDYALIQQQIEGFNSADFLFGTADAQDVTVSFWVRSSLTGTFCLTLLNSALNRSYVSEYTINATNTWEYKTITVPGDANGTWLTDNGSGLQVRFGITAGTDYQQAAGSWGTVNAVGSSNQTQLLETLNATWYVTGVQLEAGSVATPFERRSYGQELSLCQRYYQTIQPTVYSYTAGPATVYVPVTWQTMRDTPIAAIISQSLYSNTTSVTLVPEGPSGGRLNQANSAAGYGGASGTYSLTREF